MTISIDTIISSSIEKVWQNWINPDAIKEWNHASPDWHCPKATSDFVPGGNFSYTMSSLDGKNSFDFGGMFTKIENLKTIEYKLGDGREVSIDFDKVDENNTIVSETFETEEENSMDKQQQGWQAILDNFKNYCETQK